MEQQSMLFECKDPSYFPTEWKVTETEYFYLKSLEQVWKVKQGNEFVPYIIQPHQVEWHLDDVILKKEEAPIRIVLKSRGTSFTTSSSISLLTSLSEYKNEVIPLVRLNKEKAIEFIDNLKSLIRNMTPLTFVDEEGKVIYWPFNPANFDLGNSQSIRLRDDYGNVITAIKAFPANADSSENIRSIRTYGHCGILDETNFMRYYISLYTALRHSTSGTINGKKIQQFDIGTTLKGETPFSEWVEKQKEKNVQGIKFYDWPVFDRRQYRTDIPFYENQKLVSIVKWHTKEELWNEYKSDDKVFLEELMAEKVDSDEQFYDTELLLRTHVIEPERLEAIDLTQYEKVYIGIDPASKKDYFVLSLWGYLGGDWKERYLFYKSGIKLPTAKKECIRILDYVCEQVSDWLCTIDATPIGLDLFQDLQQQYGAKFVRGVTGNKSVKVTKDNKIKINEFGHTLIKRYMNEDCIEFLLDELSIKHMKSVTYKYTPEHTGDGHGDIAMARLYALLPENLEAVKKKKVITNISENYESVEKEEEQKEAESEDMLSKIQRFRKRK